MSQSESSKRRAKHRALGLCTECNEKAFDGYSQCERHHLKALDDKRKRYHRIIKDKRERGICLYQGCDHEAISGCSYCGYHQEMTADKQARFHAKNIAAGLCPCGRPVQEGLNRHEVPFKMCPSCIESRQKSDKRRREAKRLAKIASMEAQDV